jgi:ABC-type glycerol-3-phosphate transport system substrate-binding protein
MLAAAEQLAQMRGTTVETYGLLDFSTPFVILFAELQAAGVDLLSSRAEKIRLDTPEMETALNRVAALAKSGAIYYDPKTSGGFDSDQIRQPILDQKAGMWRRGMLEMSGPNPSPPSFAVGTLPYPPLPLPFFSNVRGYVMSSGTQYPQEAWRWLSYLSRQEVKPPYAGPDMVSLVPARKSVAERAGYWKQLDQETAAAVHAVLDRPAPQTRASFNFDNRIFEPIQQAIDTVLRGEKRAAQAARDAQAALEQVILETATTPTPVADTSPIVVATPVAEVVPEGATQVTFSAVAADPVVVRRAADAFNRLGTGVYVKVEGETFSGGPTDLASVAARTDCFTWYSPPTAEEITATLDLQPLLDADTGTSGGPSLRDDVPEALLAPFRHGSGLYGLPYAVDFRVLSYNKTAFEAAGLTPPRADWTQEEFLSAAQKLTSGSGSQKTYGFVSTGNTAEDLRFLMQRFGAELTSGSGAELRPTFTNPKTLQMAQFVVDLLRTTSPHERLDGYRANESIDGSRTFQLISNGKAGLWLSYGLWGFGGMGRGTTVAVAPPPMGGALLGREDVNVTGLYISAKSQHPDACWAWLNYLSTNVESLVGRFPARLSVVQSEAFGKQAPPGAVEVYTAYRDELKRAPAPTPQPEAQNTPSVDFYWLFQALDWALQGKDLARELKTAQELTEQDLECQRGGGDPAGCATSVDPDYKGFRTPPR